MTALSKSRTAEARTVERARIVLACLEGKEIQLYGDGSQLRDLTYVDDVVDALPAANFFGDFGVGFGFVEPDRIWAVEALGLQVGVNYANDYFDGIRGVRVGKAIRFELEAPDEASARAHADEAAAQAAEARAA